MNAHAHPEFGIEGSLCLSRKRQHNQNCGVRQIVPPTVPATARFLFTPILSRRVSNQSVRSKHTCFQKCRIEIKAKI